MQNSMAKCWNPSHLKLRKILVVTDWCGYPITPISRGEITPVTPLFMAIYRGELTPFASGSGAHLAGSQELEPFLREPTRHGNQVFNSLMGWVGAAQDSIGTLDLNKSNRVFFSLPQK